MKAILIGTSHKIQRGELKGKEFNDFLRNLCENYNISALAEEIDDKCTSIASSIAKKYSIKYKIIEPTPDESETLGVEQVDYIQFEFMSKMELKEWPNELNEEIPKEIYDEYLRRVEATYRKREAEWLKRIQELDSWPLLIICGADHYENFAKLLSDNRICVKKENSRWGL